MLVLGWLAICKYLKCESEKNANFVPGKLHRLLEGPVQTFPGNASLAQYFQAGFGDSQRIAPFQTALFDDEKIHNFKHLDEVSARMAEVIRKIIHVNYRNMNPDQDIVIGVCM